MWEKFNTLIVKASTHNEGLTILREEQAEQSPMPRHTLAGGTVFHQDLRRDQRINAVNVYIVGFVERQLDALDRNAILGAEFSPHAVIRHSKQALPYRPSRYMQFS